MDRLSQRWIVADEARSGGKTALAAALRASRERTLALSDCYASTLGSAMRVPNTPQFNPPLWELGHVGWFQEYWLRRNAQSLRGIDGEPDDPRLPSLLAHADSLYDSSNVAHDSRWELPLLDAGKTRAYLDAVLDSTLDLLRASDEDDRSLYFFRLVLMHEEMHGEAAVYSAQALGVPVSGSLRSASPATPEAPATQITATGRPALRGSSAARTLRFDACDWELGSRGAGFAFDNELVAQRLPVPEFEIDERPVRWRDYLEFVDAHGYDDPQWWSPEGWTDIQSRPSRLPRYVRRSATSSAGFGWQCQRFGAWQSLDPDAPAVHLNHFEAQAWCRWAGRVLPTEAQWERAAMSHADFSWGEVWEWTASTFDPYPGFVAHPYRDYSAPWFGTRPVLRGAGQGTTARMTHPKYRNFFTPERNDIHAGFRSCRHA
ncbi:MAG: selenoneine synthase SenA [Casimicrobiaceae bacterium]